MLATCDDNDHVQWVELTREGLLEGNVEFTRGRGSHRARHCDVLFGCWVGFLVVKVEIREKYRAGRVIDVRKAKSMRALSISINVYLQRNVYDDVNETSQPSPR